MRACLAEVAIGESVPRSDDLDKFLSALERFVSHLLREKYLEFKHESLDGILPVLSRKLESCEVEVFAMAVLITDQTLAPFHVRLALSAMSDEVDRLELRFGDEDQHGRMRRTPYTKPERLEKLLCSCAMNAEPDKLNWRYHLGIGPRFT